MLFRTIDGKLIEINKYDFKNDKMYYEKLMNIHKLFVNNETPQSNYEKTSSNSKSPLSKL